MSIDGPPCRTPATERLLLANPEVLVFDIGSIRDGRTRVAVDNGRIVGFATTSLRGEIAELDDLFVDLAWMRRGVARALCLMRCQ